MKNFTGTDDSNTPNDPNNLISALGLKNPVSQAGGDDDATKYFINYNDKFAQSTPAMFRDGVIAQTLGVLISKNKPNPLLIGAAGVGKTRIAEDIARRLATKDPTIPDMLADSIIYELPLSNIVADSGIVGQLEAKVQEIIKFAADKQNHCILFIDEIHQLTGDNQIYGKIAQILKPALARGDIRVIGATTIQEAKTLDDDPALNRRFTKVIVDELTSEQTVETLKSAKASFITHYANKILIDDATLETVTTIADRFGKAASHRPDTALTLLDRACGDAIIDRKLRVIQAKNDPALAQVFQASPFISLTEEKIRATALRMVTGQATEQNLDAAHLTQALSEVQGQSSVCTEIVEILERRDKGLFPMTTPVTLMFAGTSGVGKTKTAKIIASELYNTKPIMLNMTEFHTASSINRIIGAPAGYIGSDSKAELPFDILESNPYQVILLDEFEKADKSVQRLFMGAFDEGFITTAKNTTIDFSKAIIIATTNASHTTGATHAMGFSADSNQAQNEATIDNLSQWFDAELLNRFTKILTFNEITKDIYADIIAKIYKAEMARIKTARRGYTAPDELDAITLDTIVNDTYVKKFGARPAQRVVQDYIATIL